MRAGRQLRRIHGQLDSRPHRPLQVRRVARRYVQPIFGVGHDGRALVQQLGVPGHAVYESRHVQQVVSAQLVEEFQDADAGRPRPARLPARRERRIPAFHHAASDGRAVEDAVLPRRRPLGTEAAEFAAVVQDGE